MVFVHRKLVLDAICIIEGIYLVIKQCVICGKEFDTKDRGGAAITCSKVCSKKRHTEKRRAYDRIHDPIRDPIRNKTPKRRKQKRESNRRWRQKNPNYHAEYRAKHPKHQTKREKETPGLNLANMIARQNANYQCELTGWGGPLRVHHLNGYALFPDQRTNLNNLIVLHDDVHKNFHSIYGYKGSNINNFSEFVYQKFPLQYDQFRMSKYKYLPEHTYNT